MSLALRVVNETVSRGSRDYEFRLPPWPPRSRTEMEITLAWGARGLHRITDVRMIATDPLGMYRRGGPSTRVGGTFLGLAAIYDTAGVKLGATVAGGSAGRARAPPHGRRISGHPTSRSWRRPAPRALEVTATGRASCSSRSTGSARKRRCIWLDLWSPPPPPPEPSPGPAAATAHRPRGAHLRVGHVVAGARHVGGRAGGRRGRRPPGGSASPWRPRCWTSSSAASSGLPRGSGTAGGRRYPRGARPTWTTPTWRWRRCGRAPGARIRGVL